MSGTPSRERRKQAVKAAKDAVYRLKGVPYSDDVNPFDNDRQRRIFEKSYGQLSEHFHNMESLASELFEVYGHPSTIPRSPSKENNEKNSDL